MKFPNGLSRAVQVSFCLLVSLALLLASCGGGGGSSSPPPPPPFISADLNSFPTGSIPTGFNTGATVSVLNDSSGASITTATVIMNGVTLTYNVTNQDYEGNVVVAPGGAVTLSVTVSGNTYTASGTQFTSYPTISAPVPGDTWQPGNANTVTWSGGSPITTAQSYTYGLGVLDANNPNGNLVWPGFLQEVPIGTTSYPIPSNSLTVGNRLVIAGILTILAIPNTAPGSVLVIGGFNYVPITVNTWTLRTFGGGVLTSVTWSGTKFVAVGLSGLNGIAYTSPDGITWTSQTVTASPLYGVTWSGSQFVAFGDTGTVVTSPDGATWTTRPLGAILYSTAWSGTNFVAVGLGGGIYTSPDGVTWTKQTSGTTLGLSGVTWSGTNFVAVGQGGTILTSPNGVTWTSRTSGTVSGLSGVTWSGTQFVALGDAGTILTSPDGVTWTTQNSGFTSPLYSIAWSGTNFVAVGSGGSIFASPDGVTWTKQTSGTVFNLYGVAWSGTEIVVVGDSTILTFP